ncbi:CoA-binding protein, partial [Acinetobacter baumannii]
CYPSLGSLPTVPDLVVLATPGRTIAGLVAEASALGVPAAVVISALERDGYAAAADKIAKAARAHGLRIVGPNCFGVIA